MPTTTEEKIALINTKPCNPGQMTQTINNITNILNQINGNGSVIARCTLTSDNLTCAPDQLAVSGAVPLVKDFAALGIPPPTTARQYLNIATHDSQTGYIIYNWDAQEWEVQSIEQAQVRALTTSPILEGHTMRFPNDLISVNRCDNIGFETLTFETALVEVVTDLGKDGSGIVWDITEIEVWGIGPTGSGSIPTTTARAIRQMFKDDCEINYREVEMEVFSSSDLSTVNGAWSYDEIVNLIGDIYQNSDGNIVAYYVPIRVPCSGVPFEEVVLYVEHCTSSGSSGG